MSKSSGGEQADERPIGKAELRQRVDMLLSSFGLKDQKKHDHRNCNPERAIWRAEETRLRGQSIDYITKDLVPRRAHQRSRQRCVF